MTTTDSTPARINWDEREAADRAYRDTLPPIDPKTIAITIARGQGRLSNDICTRCGRDEALGLVVNIAAPTVDDHLCRACVETLGRHGEALASMVEAIEEVDHAITWTDGSDATNIAGLAQATLDELLKYRFGAGITAAIAEAESSRS